ncbi:hypothetical protein [Streptomyces sp. NBC_00083]|uniref:hypothetical protein n=1 Tax=Streptomyces sp. NBC_00083 TaxID=2975647 RepID=UPI00225AD1A2|nr:hypothetical protein [Streptomyces sp. NBC_00083]MCX5387369.1 hypothetical protein [Streptomyces sp. NBC_00083]
MTRARDLLELLLPTLPFKARRELEALLATLDAELWRRTLPDPHAGRRPWRGDQWWHCRLYDETSHHWT